MIYVWFVFRNDDVWDPSADGHVGQSSTAARTRKWSQSGSDQSWSKGSTKQNYSMKNKAVLTARKKFFFPIAKKHQKPLSTWHILTKRTFISYLDFLNVWIVCLFNFSNLFSDWSFQPSNGDRDFEGRTRRNVREQNLRRIEGIHWTTRAVGQDSFRCFVIQIRIKVLYKKSFF